MTTAIIELRSGASRAALQDALDRAGIASESLDGFATVAIAPFRPDGTGPVRDRLDKAIMNFGLEITLNRTAQAVIADQQLLDLLDLIAPLHKSSHGEVSITSSATSYDASGNELIRILIADDGQSGGLLYDQLVMLETNIDDMSPQFFELLCERLFGAGALDVWTSTIAMKKGRPAICLHILASPAEKPDLIAVLIEQSTTLGVRSYAVDRQSVPRRFESVETRWGTVQVKLEVWQGHVLDIAPEYDDCAAIARANDVPVRSVWAEAYNIGQVYIGRRASTDALPILQLIDPLGAPPQSG